MYLFFASKAQSLPRLKEDTKLGKYDAIFHIGDFAYDLHNVSLFFHLTCCNIIINFKLTNL